MICLHQQHQLVIFLATDEISVVNDFKFPSNTVSTLSLSCCSNKIKYIYQGFPDNATGVKEMINLTGVLLGVGHLRRSDFDDSNLVKAKFNVL